MSLIPFLNLHAGQTAWLFGKGPSLQNYDFKQAGKLRFAINDVIAHIPDCKYGFANDGVAKWRDVYHQGQILFQPLRAISEFDSRNGAVNCEVVTYKDFQDDSRLALPREQIAELPTIRRGTLGSALQIMHVMGIVKIYMVGFDGGGDHAQGFEWRTRLRNDHAADYNAIRNAAIDAAELMGIQLHFHNQDNIMEPNGKIFVRFLSNSFVKGIPYAQGEVVSFNPKIAQDLTACRAAEYFKHKPAQPAPIENAALPMQATESAVISATKPKKSKA